MIMLNHMAGEKQFHAGILIVSNKTKEPVCRHTTSVNRSDPAASNALTAASVSDNSYEIICADARMPPKSEYLLFDDHPATVTP